MEKILIITIRSKGGGAEKIVDNLIKSNPNDFSWINMEHILERNFIIKYFIFLLDVFKNLKKFKKIIIGTEGVLGLIIYPFKMMTNKKFILWNHCYFDDYKFFLSLKNRCIYSLVYKLYKLKINASPACNERSFIPNPYTFIRTIRDNKFKNTKKITLLSISSLAKLKNVDATIRLISVLPLYVNLKIYGEGKEENELKELCCLLKLEDRVSFLGFINDPFSCAVNTASILVINSKTEALPTIILEAIERCIPVIVKYYTGAEYWNEINSVFVFQEITEQNVIDTVNYFKQLNDEEYNSLFSSDFDKLKIKHSYKNFIDKLELI